METTINTAELLSLDQVAAEMGVVRKTVRRWCRSGKLQASKVFGQWLVEPDQLEVYKKKRAAKKYVRTSPSMTMVEKPRRARRKPIGYGSDNMRRIHENADKLVAARLEFINKKFPPGGGHDYQEVFEYVLHNMPPQGLRSIEIEYEDKEIYERTTA